MGNATGGLLYDIGSSVEYNNNKLWQLNEGTKKGGVSSGYFSILFVILCVRMKLRKKQSLFFVYRRKSKPIVSLWLNDVFKN